MSIYEQMRSLAERAKQASRHVARLTQAEKDRALLAVADALEGGHGAILEANEADLAAAREKGITGALLDRLALSPDRIGQMAEGLREVASLPDPVGEVQKMWRRPNGLTVGKVRIPLGVVLVIYEARPNVTIDAAGLCLKSGNAVILRGGSEALRSNLALARVLAEGLESAGVDPLAAQVVDTTDREASRHLLSLSSLVSLAIPRGGPGLIRFVEENARVPLVHHAAGVCHVFVDRAADVDTAISICYNSKVQRPGVCNAVETLLVDQPIAGEFLPRVAERLQSAGVELRGCPRTQALVPGIAAATEEDWTAEYLDLVLAIRVVDDFDDATDHIARYGSDHTETIVTRDHERAQRFLREVHSSCVLINASTRFNDGNQLGLGAEIGISTSKLHAFGPMGLAELTAQKFIVYGEGQIRE